MGNWKSRITATVLAGAVFAGSLMPCHRANGYQKDGVELKPGIYQQLDNVYRMSPGNPEDWVKSGNYYYEFLDSEKRYITIRKIGEEAVVGGKLVVPKEIDGYPVLGISILYSSWFNDISECCVMEHPETVRELVLPEGLEFLGGAAFNHCDNLIKLQLPSSLAVISDYALCGIKELPYLEFPYRVFSTGDAFGPTDIQHAVIYSDCLIPFVDEALYFKKELRIVYHDEDCYRYVLRAWYATSKVYIDPRIRKFELRMDTDDGENVSSGYIDKLIINGKNTKWVTDKNILLAGPTHYYAGELIHEKGVKRLYTVKGAESVKTAKKYKISYYWKETGKSQEIRGKKKDGQYKASWKKRKTVVCNHKYNLDKEKWKNSKSTVKTTYKIYGKKTKNGTYKLLKTTTKNSIKSEYKYIKAVPVKTWD